jgi:hypothetical protein
MRTIAMLNLPASTSGIWRSAPPFVPVPAQSAEPPPDGEAASDGVTDAAVDASAEAAVDGALVAVPLEQAPTTNTAVSRTVAHDM